MVTNAFHGTIPRPRIASLPPARAGPHDPGDAAAAPDRSATASAIPKPKVEGMAWIPKSARKGSRFTPPIARAAADRAPRRRAAEQRNDPPLPHPRLPASGRNATEPIGTYTPGWSPSPKTRRERVVRPHEPLLDRKQIFAFPNLFGRAGDSYWPATGDLRDGHRPPPALPRSIIGSLIASATPPFGRAIIGPDREVPTCPRATGRSAQSTSTSPAAAAG